MHVSKNALEVLFGSKLRVKILKYILRNEGAFSLKELAHHIQEPQEQVEQELANLIDIRLLTIK